MCVVGIWNLGALRLPADPHLPLALAHPESKGKRRSRARSAVENESAIKSERERVCQDERGRERARARERARGRGREREGGRETCAPFIPALPTGPMGEVPRSPTFPACPSSPCIHTHTRRRRHMRRGGAHHLLFIFPRCPSRYGGSCSTGSSVLARFIRIYFLSLRLMADVETTPCP